MKTTKKIGLILAVIVTFQTVLKAQESRLENSTKTTQDKQVVVNKEMINRFNACEPEGEYISWSSLLTSFDNQSLMDLYITYINADLTSETMNDIKLAFEKTHQEHLDNSNISEQELAWYNRVKREINNKLILSEVTALVK